MPTLAELAATKRGAAPNYDNAWLRAHEQPAREFSRDIPYAPEELAARQGGVQHEASADQLLNEARGALGSADALSARTGSVDLAAAPDRLAALSAENRAARPSLRGFTESLATGGRLGTTASLPAAFIPGGQGIAAVMGLGGTAMQVPDMLRRAYAPEEGEEAPGAMEAGFAGLGLIPGMAGLKGASRGYQSARPLGPSQFGFRQAQATRATSGAASAAPAPGRPSMDPWSNTPLGRVGTEVGEVAERTAPVARSASELPASWQALADTATPSNLQRVGRTAEEAGERMGANPLNLSRTRTYGDLNERVKQGGVQFGDDPANLSRTRTMGDLNERVKTRGIQDSGPGRPVTPEDINSSLSLTYGQDMAMNPRMIPSEYMVGGQQARSSAFGENLLPSLDALTQSSDRMKTIQDHARAFRNQDNIRKAYGQ